jgi:hypothetical protein
MGQTKGGIMSGITGTPGPPDHRGHDSSGAPYARTPLPRKPSVEFEKKRAKALLDRLESGDADARSRLRTWHPRAQAREAEGLQLADAQLVLAREYGFASWPKLVKYFEAIERHDKDEALREAERRSCYEPEVAQLLASHRSRDTTGIHPLRHIGPFWTMPDAEILATPIAEAVARCAVAAVHGFPTWDMLLRPHDANLQQGAFGRGLVAIRKRDLDWLTVLVDEHPELLDTRVDGVRSESLLRNAILQEMREPHSDARALSDYLVSRGASLPDALNPMLIQALKADTADIAHLLERGADPSWVPPNGIPVLEYALIRYWNRDAVDLVARRVTPREAFWICAGLGDVEGTLAYLEGLRPNDAGRAFRPDFSVMGSAIPPDRLGSTDEAIVGEAFIVAGMNNRAGVLKAFVNRGFPIDYRWLGDMTLLQFAVGNQLVGHVETLLQLGADPDASSERAIATARQVARERLLVHPEDPDVGRIHDLVGGDRATRRTTPDSFVRGAPSSPNDPGTRW